MRSRSGKVRLKASREELLACGVLLEDRAAQAPLDLPAIFGNRLPVEVEIGPGKGTFLLRRAADRPEVNLLALEWVDAYAMYAADRVRRAGLGNVRVLRADAGTVFRARLGEACLTRVHIYFPDPWPKRRHRRRRLIQPAFLHDLRRALRIGGWVGIVTDHEEYSAQIRRCLAQAPGLLAVPFAPAAAGELVGTNFERKYAAARKGFHAVGALRYR